MPAAPRTALVAGGTGLVGRHLIAQLLGTPAYGRVVTLGRRPIPTAAPQHTHHVVDFDRLEEAGASLAADDVFCCLGTTMKQAGSREAFRRVDFAYPVALAREALKQGARQYLLVSALGAKPTSLFFYNRVKGEAEEAVAALPYEGVYVFRPSLLTGERREVRAGEQVAARVLGVLTPLLRGPLRPLRPTPAADVAAAMARVALARPGGLQHYGPVAIREGARRQAG